MKTKLHKWQLSMNYLRKIIFLFYILSLAMSHNSPGWSSETSKPLPAEKRAAIEGGTPPSFGPKDAKVVLVEFSDFECSYCSDAAKVVKQIKKKYPDKIHFIFRQYPLPTHKNSYSASLASLAAKAQGKFWEYHDLLFENQQSLEQEALEKYATKLKLNINKFKSDMKSENIKKSVNSDSELGDLVKIQGTPEMFINGIKVNNPTNFEELSKLIENLLYLNY